MTSFTTQLIHDVILDFSQRVSMRPLNGMILISSASSHAFVSYYHFSCPTPILKTSSFSPLTIQKIKMRHKSYLFITFYYPCQTVDIPSCNLVPLLCSRLSDNNFSVSPRAICLTTGSGYVKHAVALYIE